MKKRFIPTIIAIILLVILGLYSNKYEVDEIKTPEEEKAVDILDFYDSDIKYISFGKGGNYNIKIELASPSAKILAPSPYRCDNAEAYGIARHFAELKSEYLFDENATDTSVFGITPESPSVKIETATKSVELTLGSKVPVSTSLYLKKKDDPQIYIVPSHIKGSFEKTLDDLRDRALYYEDFGNREHIDYTCGTESFSLTFNKNDMEWVIDNTKYYADNVEIANLINNMRNLRISKFEDGNILNEDKYSFPSPSLKISVKNDKGKTYELKTANINGADIYVSSNNTIVQMANNKKVDELRLTLNEIRSKFLDLFPYTKVSEIEATDASGTVNVVKKDNKWLNGEIAIKDQDIKDLLNAMSRSKVNEYTEKQNLEVVGLDKIENCSKLTIKSEDKVLNYWLGEVKGSALFMMNEEEVIQISSEFSDGFKKFILRVRNAK